jgi:hypothetical protein
LVFDIGYLEFGSGNTEIYTTTVAASAAAATSAATATAATTTTTPLFIIYPRGKSVFSFGY